MEEGIASLQAKYDECINKKQELEFKTEQCAARLGRAEKVRVKLFCHNTKVQPVKVHSSPFMLCLVISGKRLNEKTELLPSLFSLSAA